MIDGMTDWELTQDELGHEEYEAQELDKTRMLASLAGGNEFEEDPIETVTLSARRSALFSMRQYMLDNDIMYVKE